MKNLDNQNPLQPVCSIRELASEMRQSYTVAYSLVRNGTIPSFKLGSRRFIPLTALKDAMLKAQLAE